MSAARPLHPTQLTNADASFNVCVGPKSDIQFADRVAGYATFVIVWLDGQKAGNTATTEAQHANTDLSSRHRFDASDAG